MVLHQSSPEFRTSCPVSKGDHAGSVTLWIRCPEWLDAAIAAARPVDAHDSDSMMSHVTLLHWPASDAPDVYAVRNAVVDALHGTPRMRAELTGVALFYGGAAVYTVSIPGVDAVRTAAVDAHPPKTTRFGLVPHVTGFYNDADQDRWLLPTRIEAAWDVTQLEIVSDDEIIGLIELG